MSLKPIPSCAEKSRSYLAANDANLTGYPDCNLSTAPVTKAAIADLDINSAGSKHSEGFCSTDCDKSSGSLPASRSPLMLALPSELDKDIRQREVPDAELSACEYNGERSQLAMPSSKDRITSNDRFGNVGQQGQLGVSTVKLNGKCGAGLCCNFSSCNDAVGCVGEVVASGSRRLGLDSRPILLTPATDVKRIGKGRSASNDHSSEDISAISGQHSPPPIMYSSESSDSGSEDSAAERRPTLQVSHERAAVLDLSRRPAGNQGQSMIRKLLSPTTDESTPGVDWKGRASVLAKLDHLHDKQQDAGRGIDCRKAQQQDKQQDIQKGPGCLKSLISSATRRVETGQPLGV